MRGRRCVITDKTLELEMTQSSPITLYCEFTKLNQKYEIYLKHSARLASMLILMQ